MTAYETFNSIKMSVFRSFSVLSFTYYMDPWNSVTDTQDYINFVIHQQRYLLIRVNKTSVPSCSRSKVVVAHESRTYE